MKASGLTRFRVTRKPMAAIRAPSAKRSGRRQRPTRNQMKKRPNQIMKTYTVRRSSV